METVLPCLSWRGLRSMLFVLLLLVFIPTVSRGQGPSQAAMEGRSGRKINIEAGKSIILRPQAAITRISIATPEIADFVLLSPRQVYVTGKAPGVTTMTLWQDNEKIEGVYDLEVSADVSRLKSKLHELLPEENDLRILGSHDGITLAGTASSAGAVAQAVALAETYAPNKKVVNLIQVAGVQQVMLEVRVAEMARNLTDRLSINFLVNKDGSFGNSLLGNLAGLEKTELSTIATKQEFKLSPTLNALFHIVGPDGMSGTAFIDALKEDGLVRVLAEPTLIALSGQTASFLAGGEFPIPVPQGLGTVAIEFKKFGVSLSFTPTVLSNRKINMIVSPEVSELDFTTAIEIAGVQVPGLTTRRVATTIELGDGQSFAIAGLLQDTIRETIDRYPVLGSIPVLGTLFRSSSFQNRETELVVVVTPRLVKPLDLAKQPLPTDRYVRPTDTEFFLHGNLQGAAARPGAPPYPIKTGRRAGMEGDFGHVMNEQ